MGKASEARKGEGSAALCYAFVNAPLCVSPGGYAARPDRLTGPRCGFVPAWPPVEDTHRGLTIEKETALAGLLRG